MKNLKTINSKDDLIKVSRIDSKELESFPGTYNIYVREDALPVVHTPQEIPNSHTTPGRQEAVQANGTGSECPCYRTNR